MGFFLEYLRHPSTIGAVAPSSRWLARKMIEAIRFNRCKCIVEYGPGTGAFTNELIRRKKADTILLIIEQNNEFYTLLKKKYRGIPNVIIKNGDVGNIKEYLVQYNIPHVNYIVSGLPFTSLPTDISDRILNITKEILGKKGRFITFQYTLLKLNFFKQYFKIRKVTLEFWNIPPAYVIVMTN